MNSPFGASGRCRSAAGAIDLDEEATRLLIDGQLRLALDQRGYSETTLATAWRGDDKPGDGRSSSSGRWGRPEFGSQPLQAGLSWFSDIQGR